MANPDSQQPFSNQAPNRLFGDSFPKPEIPDLDAKIAKAKAEGFSDDEINETLVEIEKDADRRLLSQYGVEQVQLGPVKINLPNPFNLPKLDDLIGYWQKQPGLEPKIESARKQGFSDDEIVEFLKQETQEQIEEKKLEEAEAYEDMPTWQKAARLPGMFALGSVLSKPMTWVYDLSVSPLASKSAQTQAYRQLMGEEVERIQELEAMGLADNEDRAILTSFKRQLSGEHSTDPYVQTANLTIPSLIAATTGVDTDPKGIFEKGAMFLGFMRGGGLTPRGVANQARAVWKEPVKEIKAMLPPGSDLARASGAAAAWQAAEDGGAGPAGTIAATIFGDLMGAAALASGKGAINLTRGTAKAIMNPRQALARATGRWAGNSKKAWQDELIREAKEAGVQLDVGTLTDSNMIKGLQTKLAQSSLVGEELDNFRRNMSQQIVNEYNAIADTAGDVRFNTSQQAIDSIVETIAEQNRSIDAQIPQVPRNQKIVSPSKKTPRAGDAYPLRDRIDLAANPTYESTALLEAISPAEVPSSAAGGKQLKTQLYATREPIKRTFQRRYQEMEQRLSQEVIEDLNLATEVDAFVNEFEGSLLLGESAPEAKVVRVAQNLRNKLLQKPLYDTVQKRSPNIANSLIEDLNRGLSAEEAALSAQKKYPWEAQNLIKLTNQPMVNIAENVAQRQLSPSAKPIALNEMIQTKRTLAAIPDWEIATSNITNNLKRLVRQLDEAIVGHIERSGQEGLAEAYEALQADYSSFKTVFEDKNVRPYFEPRNSNYSSLYRNAVHNPDKFRAVDQILQMTPEGQNFSRMIKRDIAENFVRRPEVTAREIADLREVLGPEFKPAIDSYVRALEAGPTARQGVDAGVRPAATQRPVSRTVRGEVSPAQQSRKFAEVIGKKSGDQILRMMDSVEGIRKIKGALQSQQGKKLFDALLRYKLDDMIGRRMADSVTGKVKLGTFANLAKTPADRAVVRELIGADGLARLDRLQRVSGRLADTANKFYNSSQSATVAADTAVTYSLLSAGLNALTGNYQGLAKLMGGLGGSRKLANLMADPEFLKLVESELVRGKPATAEAFFAKAASLDSVKAAVADATPLSIQQLAGDEAVDQKPQF